MATSFWSIDLYDDVSRSGTPVNLKPGASQALEEVYSCNGEWVALGGYGNAAIQTRYGINVIGPMECGKLIEIKHGSTVWYEGVLWSFNSRSPSNLDFSAEGLAFWLMQGIKPSGSPGASQTLNQIVTWLYTNYISSLSLVGASNISTDTARTYTITFSGDKTLVQILNQLAQTVNATWGITGGASRTFHFLDLADITTEITVDQSAGDIPSGGVTQSGGLDDVFNRVTVRGSYNGTTGERIESIDIDAEDASSQSKFGVREARPLEADYITTAADATELGKAWLAERAQPVSKGQVTIQDHTSATPKFPWTHKVTVIDGGSPKIISQNSQQADFRFAAMAEVSYQVGKLRKNIRDMLEAMFSQIVGLSDPFSGLGFDKSEWDTLTGGPLSNAEDLHTHDNLIGGTVPNKGTGIVAIDVTQASSVDGASDDYASVQHEHGVPMAEAGDEPPGADDATGDIGSGGVAKLAYAEHKHAWGLAIYDT